MWSSMMAPQGSSFSGNFLAPKGVNQQQYRDFNMTVIAPGKSFKNPNFVNNFNKYRHFDSCSVHTNLKNPCHIHIIDSIKERCPEVIPHLEEKEEPSPSASEIRCETCLDNNTMHQHRKREHTPRKKRQLLGKKSRHNIQRKELKEIMLVEDQDLSNHSLDNSFSPKPQSLILKDFIMPIRLCETLPPLQKMEPAVTTKVFLTISPSPSNRTRQYSITDSEDSFVVFDHNDVDETTMKTKDDTDACRESLNRQRRRIPSICESEDSFIMFDRDDLDSIEDEDTFEGSSTEESDQDSSNDDDDDAGESGCDEIDFSFSIIDRKKVRFAPPDRLCEVHPMVKWSYAYQAARKGPWEMYARDRSRFKDRAWRVERDIKHVFDPHHRDRVYRERFEDL